MSDPKRAAGGLSRRRRPTMAAVTLTVAAALLASAIAARAVSVMDLVHDTPAVRKRYRMDIVGFSTETAPTAGEQDSPGSAEHLWLAREKYLELGETEKADAQIEGLINWRKDKGRRNLVPFAVLLVREAFREADTGNLDRSDVLLGLAARLAPDYPPVYLAQGHVALRRSRFAVPAFLVGLVGGSRAVLREAYHLVIFMGRLSGAAAFIIAAVSTIWALALLARYAAHLRHDVEEYLWGGRRLYAGRRRVAIVLGLFVPLVVFASPLWLVVLAVFVSWAYQNRGERVLSLAAACLLATLPFLTWTASSSLVFLGDDLNQALMAFRNGSETASQARVLEESYRSRPDDAVVGFALGQHYWREGRYKEAEELYRKIKQSGGRLKLESTVNLGNVMMAKGDLKAAAETYREAIGIRADSAAAHYNLGQVLNLQFDFKAGEEEVRKAVEADRARISGLASAPGSSPQRALLGEDLPLKLILERVASVQDLQKLRSRGLNLWRLSLTGVQGLLFPPMVAMMAFGGFLYGGFLRRRGLTRRCAKCGRPFCPLCVPGGGKLTVCPQCQHIFVVKEGIESAMRVEKMMEVKAYQARRRRTGLGLSMLMPGGGQIFFGRPLQGILLALTTSVLLLAVLGWEGPFVDRQWMVFPWRGFYPRAAAAGLLVLYAANLFGSWRLGRRER